MARWLIVVAAALSACASFEIRDDEALRVPAERLAAFDQQAANTERVTIKRDGAIAGTACPVYIHVDGARVVGLEPMDLAVLHIPTGKHILRAERSGGLCSLSPVEVAVDVRPGQPLKYRVGFDAMGGLMLTAQ